jgi:hypothetical protein
MEGVSAGGLLLALLRAGFASSGPLRAAHAANACCHALRSSAAMPVAPMLRTEMLRTEMFAY